MSLSKRTGLSESQVYKWAWDQKKKMNGGSDSCTSDSLQFNKANSTTVTRDEFGGYSCKRWGTEK